jgi:ribonuclease PH
MRSDKRPPDELRDTRLTPNYLEHAEGSVFIAAGRTKVICTASIEDRVPHFLRNMGRAGSPPVRHAAARHEHAMQREASTGKVGGRTRRSSARRTIAADRSRTSPRSAATIWIDCDVIQADGGTRTAITAPRRPSRSRARSCARDPSSRSRW